MWTRSYPLDQFIDIPMHLLFLGIQKTTMKQVTLWHSRRSSFEEHADSELDPTHRMQLSWCKVLPYNGNETGGWTSETCLAMSRLNKWFHGGIEKITHEDCVSDLDVLPPSRWLKNHNAAWLRLRGLSTKGLAPELKKRVAHYLSLAVEPSFSHRHLSHTHQKCDVNHPVSNIHACPPDVTGGHRKIDPRSGLMHQSFSNLFSQV